MSLIADSATLAQACSRLAQHDFITIDTEFLRETTYYSRLCIIQMASRDEAVIIDALAEGLDLAPFLALMANNRVLKVFHAGRQDIEIIWNMAQMIPEPVFDTQIAAMVLGYGDQIAYDQLVSRIVGATIDKSSRFTDWARRPLSAAQMDYAISDVTHLREVYSSLAADLERRGRSSWVFEEMATLTSPETYRMEPEQAWRRIKMRIRKPRELAILMEVAAWREVEAQRRNVPRGRILKDEALAEIVMQAPTSIARFGEMRALSRGFDRSAWGQAVVDAVKRGLARDPKTLPVLEHKKTSAQAGAIVELLRVLLRMASEQHGVAARVIASSDDLEAIALGDDAHVPALHGWRREVFGEMALDLKHGKIALALKGGKAGMVRL